MTNAKFDFVGHARFYKIVFGRCIYCIPPSLPVPNNALECLDQKLPCYLRILISDILQ